MEHDDDIRAVLQRLGITGLLIAAVAAIFRMHFHVDPQPPRDLRRIVAAVIVDQDAFVDNIGNLPHGRFQGLRGIIRRQNDHNSLSVDQSFEPRALDWKIPV